MKEPFILTASVHHATILAVCVTETKLTVVQPVLTVRCLLNKKLVFPVQAYAKLVRIKRLLVPPVIQGSIY